MLKSVLYTSAALAALTFAAHAQPRDERIVVVATRVVTPVEQVASSVTVITAREIEARQHRSLPDVLRQVSGLSITQTGGAGGQTSLFMRGTNSNHVKVLLDGIDIADPSTPSGAADISKFLAGDIAQVEVLRGPQGALYGSDGIGGVINIITKSGEGPAQFTASAEAGSFDTFNQTAGIRQAALRRHGPAQSRGRHAGDAVEPAPAGPAPQR
jgi:vitamin B12 transporter